MTLDELGWNEFNVAIAGATAALVGLVIVAASVNIEKIVKAATITARLAAAIAALVLALVVSSVGLVPGITPLWFGAGVLVATVPAAIFQAHSTAVIYRDASPLARARFAKASLGWAPIAAYTGGGVCALIGVDGALVITAVGAILAIVSAIIVSWVALVEVLR